MAKRKPNMKPEKTPMPVQDPEVRARNFKEVALGYTEEMAIEEAQRCLNCKHKPCVGGCPVHVRIPEFIMAVAEGKFEEAYEIITSTNKLPAICGRVCPQENQCEKYCVRGIRNEPVGIGRLERFVADYHREHSKVKPEPVESNGRYVAVIGSGPAGLTCAGDLASRGYHVTVFEAFHTAGGVLVYGIPEFRLPQDIIESEINSVLDLGVKVHLNTVIGRLLSIKELFEMGYEAIFIGSGAGLPSFMGIPGENLVGVYSANEYLTRTNLMKAYDTHYATPIRKSKAVAVVGGGNVAMDAARSALRLGAEKVYIVYRRSFEEMPARVEEVEHAKEEGVEFLNLRNVLKIRGDEAGQVIGMQLIEMELGEADASGRRRPIAIPDTEYELKVDTVIMAIGTSPNPLIKSTTEGLAVDKWGCVIADDHMATSIEGVYAGGDVVTGAATVIEAMGAGKIAAEAMDQYLQSKSVEENAPVPYV